MDKKGRCHVSMRLLPIKAHYFFFFGAMGSVIPFMPVLAKGLGISATAVGLVYTVLPFCIFFSKPIFGYLTDYFQNIKMIVFMLASVISVAYISVIFIPAIKHNHPTQLNCQHHQEMLLTVPLQEGSAQCLQKALNQTALCELSYRLCEQNTTERLLGTTSNKNINTPNSYAKNYTSISPSSNSNLTILLNFQPDSNFTCGCISPNSTFLSCPVLQSCPNSNEESSSVYKTFQFWVFTLLAVIGGTGAATVFCLSDAACYEILGEKSELYGRQRLWATISFGISTLLAGLFNDIATKIPGVQDYSPGFYLMIALIGIDLLLLTKIKLTKANLSLNICSDLGKIFASCETVTFACSVYVIGALTGLLWSYEFWFLQDLGASQTLLGLTIAVQCLATEVPFFFFSGWFIKIFGYFYCVAGAFAAFALRLGLYSILQDVWMVLPIELLHGITFAVFYASMTGFASNNAPPGTEATMMGILGGLYEGLGVATGSLLGGVGFDKLGGRSTFLVAAIISAICFPCVIAAHLVIQKLFPKRPSTPT